MTKRAFTVKSLIAGLIGVLVVVGFPIFASSIKLRMVGSGYLPVVPFFLMIFLCLIYNTVVGLISRKYALNQKELAVVFGFMLMTSWIPSVQTEIVRQLALPRYSELTTNKSWNEAQLTQRLPDKLFPVSAGYEPLGTNAVDAVSGESAFVTTNAAASISDEVHFALISGVDETKDVPIQQWVGPLLNWAPFVLLLVFSLMAMSFIVHRQWTVHEQLRYPLSSVVEDLIKSDEKKSRIPTIFRNKAFLIGIAIPFIYTVWQYIYAWSPESLPRMPNEYVLPWHRLFPVIGGDKSNAMGAFVVHWMPVSFLLFGIAFLVSTDVSLSLGLTAPLGTILGVQYYLVTGNAVSTPDLDIFRVGGFLAFGVILLYTGRTYYFPLLFRAMVPVKKSDKLDQAAVWAARLLLVGFAGLVAVVTWMGIDWFISIIIVGFVLLIFLVVTRLVCETGLPNLVHGLPFAGLFGGLMGSAAFGAAPVVFVTLIGSILLQNNSSVLVMPFVSTALKVADDNDVKLTRFVAVAKVMVIVALVAGVLGTVYGSYLTGSGGISKAESAIYESTSKSLLTMKDLKQLGPSEGASGLGKLALLEPEGRTVGLVLAGLITVIVAYVLRFRFSKWPLHPAFFVLLGSSMAVKSWCPFLLGWVVKSLVVKFGGGRAYRAVKPLFIGFIIGDLSGKAMILIVSSIYSLVATGSLPENVGIY